MVEKQKAQDAPDKRLGPFEVGQILTLSREGLSQRKIADKAPLRAMLAPVGVADGAPEGPPGVHLAAGQGIWGGCSRQQMHFGLSNAQNSRDIVFPPEK